ncbi:MAG: hypothetical protein AAGK97_03990, partial [Bacteroidota bacterium]
ERFRKTNASNMERMVLLYPSKKFIESLPLKRITERKDFKIYFGKDDERIALWEKTADKCKVLAEELRAVVEDGIDMNRVEKF